MNYNYTGTLNSILELILSESCEGNDIQWVPFDEWSFNGTYVESLANTTIVDMLSDVWTVNEQRRARGIVQYSFPIWQNQLSFVVHNVKAIADPPTIWKSVETIVIFSPVVWISIICLVNVFIFLNSRPCLSLFRSRTTASSSWLWFTHYLMQDTMSILNDSSRWLAN